MKRYFAVVSMMCLFALAGIAGAAAQEVQKANPATDFEYDLNQAGDGVIIQKYKGTATEVVIPAEIEDFPVVGVGVEAFSETNIVSVVFPDSIRWTGYSCFEDCNALVQIRKKSAYRIGKTTAVFYTDIRNLPAYKTVLTALKSPSNILLKGLFVFKDCRFVWL